MYEETDVKKSARSRVFIPFPGTAGRQSLVLPEKEPKENFSYTRAGPANKAKFSKMDKVTERADVSAQYRGE